MRFGDFIGNERVINQLGVLLGSGRFPHAVLLEGENGVGKKTLARDLARALVCRAEEKPCGVCSQCRKVSEGVHPDVREYIPSGAANSFHVDTVREIIGDAYLSPNEADCKVYILANADCMNASAQNALLKILEEPPSYTVFILTAASKSSMLSTVLSRCTVLTLEGVDAVSAAQLICSRIENTDFDAARTAAETFNGNIGKAIDSLKDERTLELTQTCDKICNALAVSDEYAALTACAVLQKDRQAVVFVCDMLKSIFRDALADGDTCGCISGQRQVAQLLREKLTRKKLLSLSQTCGELKKDALMNMNNSLIITKICYSLFSC